ncbi:MAG: DedA family protein [Bacteroides sp.]|nr:DedA family protein [Bacteroides sp.]
MSTLGDWGYFGLFIGCFLAATIFPFSSDALYIASLGFGGSVVLTLFWATLGNWLGGLTSYWVGYAGKWEWIEKWFRVKKETLEKQKAKVDKYGSWLALLTWLPFIGDVFAIALGFYRTKFWSTALFMLLGKFLRFAALAIIFIYFKDKVDWFG